MTNFSDYWNSKHVDAHRRGITDLNWSALQPRGNPRFTIGDVVEFKVGGFGVIAEVVIEQNGWPNQYSTRSVNGLPGHATTKRAWHYELDIKRRLFWRSLLQRNK
jgi:hypothetical protein